LLPEGTGLRLATTQAWQPESVAQKPVAGKPVSFFVFSQTLPPVSVGHLVDNNVHKPPKPRQYWLCGLCPEIDQKPAGRLSWPALFL